MKELCRKVIERDEEEWQAYKDGEEGALHYLVGQALQISGGTASPTKVRDTFQDMK